ncbi:hypothetical protein CEE36_09245 [candidate division TA06 bacterium B3_TA06]|uniref:Uncharacterized protein n=1 Tax=candidate division TA06 bacterium B3_TA06 TaxID=2012487 RepID=A0A532V026_UNCT6|nr:MAG: hypothetical protein CEE36_09245 [candidate division TA06 bacterium B3_TA06]
MKKLFLLVLFATAAFGTTWYEVGVPLEGKSLPAVLSGFDIVGGKAGYWAEIVCTQEGLKLLDQAGVDYRIIIEDLEAYYAAQMIGPTNFGDYYTYDETNAILDSLHEEYPQIISERVIMPNDSLGDTTWDGNYVWAVKISDNVGTEENEPEVLYTGIHHAREPISVNICVEWARWLCENYGSDPLATYLVDNRQIWIISIINPDGYLYNEEIRPGGGGMHRKNRRPTGAEPQGVDINRNYPYMWGYDNQGSSPDPGEETYRGPEPGSEPETQSVMNLCKEHEFVTALNFHSHFNFFICPWGYKDENCEDSAAYFAWGEIATRACHYAVFPGYQFYNTNGGSDDWMYGETEEKNRIFAATPEVGTDFWQDWRIPEQIEDTRPLMIATAKAAAVYPELEGICWSDGGDGEISPGETVDLIARVHNMSVKDESGQIGLELGGSDPRAELVKPTASISSLAPQSTGTNEADPLRVKVSASAPPDSAIPLTLTVRAAGEEFIHQITLPVGERQTLLAEDFDDQNYEGWYSNWGLTDENSHSPDYSITDSPDGPYDDESLYYLQSPALDLSDKVIAELSFWHLFSIEKGWDWGAVEAKSSQTGGWVTLRRFSGFQDEWREERFDLSGFCGTSDFRIRFTLTTDWAMHLDGWYIDDIELTAFKGIPSGLHELADIRPIIEPIQTITTGNLSFAGPAGTQVDVVVFDASGRLLARTEGTTPFSWQMQDKSGSTLPAGVYFVRTISDTRETNRKVVVID